MSLQLLRQSPLFNSRHILPSSQWILTRSYSNNVKNPTDDFGIPLRPTWSVNHLLSSYPSPKLSNETINRLYELSALTPPENASQYQAMKRNLEKMVRLVEAVRLVDTTGVSISGRGEKEDADRIPSASPEGGRGQELLRHATNTKDGFYLVDSERRR